MVLAGVIDQHLRRSRLRRIALQILIEERPQHIAPELGGCISIPTQRPKHVAFRIYLTVPPRAHHQIVMVDLTGLLQCQIAVDCTPHVLLVPKPLKPHGWNGSRALRNEPIEGLSLPEGVVRRMLNDFLGPRQLVQSVLPSKVSGGPGATKRLVVVVLPAHDFVPFVALGRLSREVVEVRLPKRAVVEPVVAHPPIDHGAFRRCDFQRRMRFEQRHHDCKPLVGRSDHSHAAIRFGHILNKPIDGVIRVGRMVRGGRVQASAHGFCHHVVAFGAVLTAYVLVHPNIAAGNKHFVGERQQSEHVWALISRRAFRCVVGSSRQHHGSILRSFG